jgi:hypothetical protein
VRMRQRRDCPCLALEPLPSGGIAGQVGREDLEGDGAVQARVSRAVDLAHPTCTGGADDLVGAEPCARVEGHHLSTLSSIQMLPVPVSIGRTACSSRAFPCTS